MQKVARCILSTCVACFALTLAHVALAFVPFPEHAWRSLLGVAVGLNLATWLALGLVRLKIVEPEEIDRLGKFMSKAVLYVGALALVAFAALIVYPPRTPRFAFVMIGVAMSYIAAAKWLASRSFSDGV